MLRLISFGSLVVVRFKERCHRKVELARARASLPHSDQTFQDVDPQAWRDAVQEAGASGPMEEGDHLSDEEDDEGDDIVKMSKSGENKDFDKIQKYLGLINGSSSFTWLLENIERQTRLRDQHCNVMDSVRDDIARPFSTDYALWSQVHSATFEMDWDPASFLQHQGYERHVVGEAITLNGDCDSGLLQAITCAQYLSQIWGSSGGCGGSEMQVLRIIQNFIDGGIQTCTLPIYSHSQMLGLPFLTRA